MRYWLYKCNVEGGPAGYHGDWYRMVFSKKRSVQWGGHYSSLSAEVHKHIDEKMSPGDVVVAYQTDMKAVVGYCRVTALKTAQEGGLEIWLQPIEVIAPFRIHDHKVGTALENSSAVNGMVMLRQLTLQEMTAMVDLSGAPKRVLKGKEKPSGWAP